MALKALPDPSVIPKTIWTLLGTVRDPAWDHLGAHLGPFWDHLGSFEQKFWLMLALLLLMCNFYLDILSQRERRMSKFLLEI